MNKTNNNRAQSRRLHKTFCSHKRRGKWQFVEVCKGTKAVPLPLLCASFFSQKKGQLPVFPTKSRWLFESKYIEHAVVAQAAKNTIASNGIPEKALGSSKKSQGLFYLGFLLSSEKKVCKDSQGASPP